MLLFFKQESVTKLFFK